MSASSRLGKIGILAGGRSSEREISLRSGKAVHQALTEKGCDAIFLDVTDNIYDIIQQNSIDIAFIALHGKFGEDGTVQSILEQHRVPYTGSGVTASRLALDKLASRTIFEERNIPVPPYMVFENGTIEAERIGRFGIPVVVKPRYEGSSIGLSVVRAVQEIPDAVARAVACGKDIIVEKYIDGREFTVGILDERPLPVVEIIPPNRVYDYDAKYRDAATRYEVPAAIEPERYRFAQDLGVSAHRALGCRSFSRVDMMMDREGTFYVLEVNSIPGLTERSLLPKAAAAAGIDFGTLCVRLIELALKGRSWAR